MRPRRPVRGDAQLSPEVRHELDRRTIAGERLSLGRAVAIAVAGIAAAVALVAAAIALDVTVLGAVVASIITPGIALLGAVWRANRGPRKLDRALRRYLSTLEKNGLMAPEYHYSAQAAANARAALQDRRHAVALGAVERMVDALGTFEVDPRVARALHRVVLRADDLARPSTGRWTPGLAIFIAGMLCCIVALPIFVGESPAAPMLSMFAGAALVGGVVARLTPKRHESWALILPIVACVALIAVMGWPDILNLAGFIGVSAGALVGMYFRDREAKAAG